jgi:hypothetical protein
MSFISALKNITLACALTGATAFAAPAEPFNSGNSVAYEPNYTPKENVD